MNEMLIDEVNEYEPGTYHYGNPHRFAFAPKSLRSKPPPPTREERERGAGPPPRREQYTMYGRPDIHFQNDRANWYEKFTGVSLEGTLAEQNEAFDVVARRFRNYNDGRADIRERLRD